ncbi:hypothetical protein K0U07_02915 [bacterium]|nr:hypothetical protein [bacterium]
MQIPHNQEQSFEEVLLSFTPWVNKDQPAYPLNRYILRRNVAGFPFAEKISKVDAKNLSEKLLSSLYECFPKGIYFSSNTLTDKNFHLLFEHLFLSNRDRLHPEGGIFIDKESGLVALLLLEDHLTLFFHDSAFQGTQICNKIQEVEEQISKTIPFAFSDRFGFITSSALNMGTGLSKEAIMHAPAINFLDKEIESNEKVQVHGLKQESTALHNLLITTNKYCLGTSENNIANEVDLVAKELYDLETKSKEEIKKLSPKKLYNTFSKNYGAITFCKSLEFHEAMQMASNLDLGIKLGAFESPNKTLFFDLFFSLRRAHLEAKYPDDDSPIEEKRARLFKEIVKDVKITI